MPPPDKNILLADTDSGEPVPERFQVAKATLRFDRFMTHAIKVGGLGIIVAVFGIFVFIFSQIWPLFRGASLEKIEEQKVFGQAPLVLGIDEWSELPFSYFGKDEIFFTDLTGTRGTFRKPLPLPEGTQVTATGHDGSAQRVLLGTSDGSVGMFTVKYRPEFDQDQNDKRTITATVEPGEFYQVGTPGSPVVLADYGDSGSAKMIAAVQKTADGRSSLRVATLKQKRGLLSAGRIEVDRDFDLSDAVSGNIQHLLVTGRADSVIAANDRGEVFYLFREGDGMKRRQKFVPFEDLDDPVIATMDFVLGDVSIAFSGAGGEQRIFSLYVPEGGKDRHWGQTKTFPSLPGPGSFFVASRRNKAFLIGSGNTASLRYSTTETIRWEDELPFEIAAAAIDGKFENIAFFDPEGTLHLYSLHDPHPEAGWKAFFGKIWYEGASKPEYVWQSTGGSDKFEAKLSLTPLVFGSLKGTFYALLFAVPIALLAAIYTAYFLLPSVKRIVKPTMEIMASLPSVVLGFLAALWLAPILETRVPSFLLIVALLPAAALALGFVWSRLPVTARAKIKPGTEYLVFTPMMLVLIWLGWELGPAMEKLFFVVTNPETGEKIADFRLWWPEVTGTPFDQRNSLVVGFMMGFAVIPVIFTIAEDALSNVPGSLTAASAALGATRWQTVRTIVIPIASAGIFSALMIGLGRAVGETMIVVMATGNTPIMEWNIFSGMRTLSANIAVELPEAPVHSTHYRTLFLGAMVLFMLTFFVNTFAEILRNHLREKFKLV